MGRLEVESQFCLVLTPAMETFDVNWTTQKSNHNLPGFYTDEIIDFNGMTRRSNLYRTTILPGFDTGDGISDYSCSFS
jgi:hypothetical protein